MTEENIYIILSLLIDKNNNTLSYSDLHKKVSDQISWDDFKETFQHLYDKSFIDNNKIVTDLGINVLKKYENETSNKLNLENKIKKKDRWEFFKLRFDVINGGAAILFLFINFYQFYIGHKNEALTQQKTQTIDSLLQVVSELTIQNTKPIHKDTLLKKGSDTISR